MTDFIPPVCKVVNVTSNDCPREVSMCEGHDWYLEANITDESGIDRVSLRQGSGNLTHTSLGTPAVQAYYRASCCSPIVEMSAVDQAGIVGKCFHSIVSSDNSCFHHAGSNQYDCFLIYLFVHFADQRRPSTHL